MALEAADAYDADLTAGGALHLSMRRLDHLPKGILRPTSPCLQSLLRLDLSFNHLRTLPTAISHLAKLQELWVNDNPLESLPDSLASCKHLQVLDCASTALSALPEGMGTLVDIRRINLDFAECLQEELKEAYEAGATEGVMKYLKWKNEDTALRSQFLAELSEGIYRAVADCPNKKGLVQHLVDDIFCNFPDHAAIKSLIRNHKRLFPEKIEAVDLAKVRRTFETLRKDNLRKKYAASLELKLRAIYFDRIDPTKVEGIVKSIYAEIQSLEDILFLMKHATKLFPKEIDDLNTAKLFQDLKLFRQRLAEERAAAVALVMTAIHALYPHVEPERCKGLAEDVVKPIKKAEDIKKLAADALGYFPEEFEAAKNEAKSIAATFLKANSDTPTPVRAE